MKYKHYRTDDFNIICFYLNNYQELEEVSELTIKNYRIHLNKFFNYVNKDLRTIRIENLIKETYSDELLKQLRNNCNNIRNLAMVNHNNVRISHRKYIC